MCANACYTVDPIEETYTDILADSSNVPLHNCHQCHPNAECRNNFDYKGFDYCFSDFKLKFFEGHLDGTYSCYCPLNSSLDGITECNDGTQCDDGNLGHITCGAKGLACKEKNKVKIISSRPSGSKKHLLGL